LVKGPPSRPWTLQGHPTLFTRGESPIRHPSAPTEFPRGPSVLQRRSERTSPNVQSMGPQGGGRRWPTTPQGGCRPRLTPKSLVANDGHRPTTHRPHQHLPKNRSGFGDPSGWNQPRKGGPTIPLEGHHTPRHRPDRSVSRRGTRHREVHAERKERANTARKTFISAAIERGAKSLRPSSTLKGCTPPIGWTFPKVKVRAKGPQTLQTRGAIGPLDGSGPQIRIAQG
jgi:hypothetical protein